MTTTGGPPRSGPCAPWVSASDVLSFPNAQSASLNQELLTDEVAAQMAMIASEILYAKSGRQFTGECGPVTVRPINRPTNIDMRGLNGTLSGGQFMVYGGYNGAWGNAGNGASARYGTFEAPEVELGAFPVLDVSLVKIDGVVIPPNEYYLQGSRTLVRRLPSASAAPTERYGWPTTQRTDLPDTEVGTFSVTFTYGAPAPTSGYWAAQKLAQMLLLDACGEKGVFPARVTSVSRQGVSVNVADVEDFFSKGMTGIYFLDLFLSTYNVNKAQGKPIAWSPDLGRPRRMPNGIT